MNYNGNEYFYITNLQGDIIELVDINGNTVVSYKYDAWGNIVYQAESTIARANQYRYRIFQLIIQMLIIISFSQKICHMKYYDILREERYIVGARS